MCRVRLVVLGGGGFRVPLLHRALLVDAAGGGSIVDDVVLVDPDPLRLDAVLAVTGPRGADPRDLTTIANHLGEIGCDLLGTVENRTAKDT